MKNINFFLILLLVVFSCKSTNNLSKEEIINYYYKLHKNILESPFEELEFPLNFSNILSEKYLMKEESWFNEKIKNYGSQLIDERSFYLGNCKIEKIINNNNVFTVYITTLHPEYFIKKDNGLDYIVKKYNCDKTDFETIFKIQKKLREMWNDGYIVGKGWYPVFETVEIHKFIFNNRCKIDDIQIDILNGNLTDSYDDVINSFIEWNKKLEKEIQ